MALHAAAIQHQDQPRADVMILMVEQAKKMGSRAADTIQAALSHELGQSTNGKRKQHALKQEWYRLVLQPASLIGVAIRRLVHIDWPCCERQRLLHQLIRYSFRCTLSL